MRKEEGDEILNSNQLEPEDMQEYKNEQGQHVCKFKMGKLKVTATFMNEPSDDAISNFNRFYNKLFDIFNK